jgi:hypothetical protein
MLGLVRWLVWFRKVGRFFANDTTRYALAWALAAWSAAVVLQSAYNHWEDPARGDGFGGHTSIDFGSSYMLTRMLVTGHGQHMYDRNHLRPVLHEAYPLEDGNPKDRKTGGDAENFMNWVMGEDSPEASKTCASCLAPLAARDGPSAAVLLAYGKGHLWTDERMAEAVRPRVGGPLYPPINAFLFAWMGPFHPRTAYTLHQGFDVLLAVLVGLAVSYMASGRVWAPVVTTVLVLYPGYFPNLHLGQTGCLALTFLAWGWALVARGRPALGGAVLGFLSFKPTWALAYFLVLVVARRWRAAAAMLAAGAALGAATLPFVGVHSWFDWLACGREATDIFNGDSNWIHLSRDLLGVPRRYLLDFGPHSSAKLRRESPEAAVAAAVGWGLVFGVAALTAALALWRRRESRTTTRGPRAAFLLLAGWLCCYHFMYYDTLLSFVGVVVLLVNPHLYLWPRRRLRQPFAWERPLVPPWRRPAPPRAAAGAAAVFRWPAAPGRGPRAVAELRLRPRFAAGWVGNAFPLLFLAGMLFLEGPLKNWEIWRLYTPLDTYALIGLWVWCGVVWAWRRRAPAPAAHRTARLPEALRAGTDGVAVTPAPAR